MSFLLYSVGLSHQSPKKLRQTERKSQNMICCTFVTLVPALPKLHLSFTNGPNISTTELQTHCRSDQWPPCIKVRAFRSYRSKSYKSLVLISKHRMKHDGELHKILRHVPESPEMWFRCIFLHDLYHESMWQCLKNKSHCPMWQHL